MLRRAVCLEQPVVVEVVVYGLRALYRLWARLPSIYLILRTFMVFELHG